MEPPQHPVSSPDAEPQPKEIKEFRLYPPLEMEGTLVQDNGGAEAYVEVMLLNCALNWIKDNFKAADPRAMLVEFGNVDDTKDTKKKLREHAKIADALSMALFGAKDSLLSILTCARLVKAKRNWDDWKDDWFRLPAAAMPAKAETASTKRKISPVEPGALIAHRHQIKMPDSPDVDPKMGRFYRGAPSQSLFSLIEVLKSEPAQSFRDAQGRRFLLLSARRGLGKGHFFSALEHCTGLLGDFTCSAGAEPPLFEEPRVVEFLRALNPANEYAQSQWVGLGFMSLSFSQEVMSAFDRVIALLQGSLAIVNRGLANKLELNYLQWDRLERLRAVLAAWALHGRDNPADKRRVLVAFNGFSVLYDREGREKNGEVKRICELFYDAAYNTAPIDFVLLCRNNRLPLALIGGDAAQAPLPLLPDPGDAKARGRAERSLMTADIGPRAPPRLARPGLEMSWRNTARPEKSDAWQMLKICAPVTEPEEGSRGRNPAVAIHVLKEARAVVLAAAYFPRVGLFVARHLMRELVRDKLRSHEIEASSSAASQDKRLYGGRFESHSKNTRDAMRLAFNAIQTAPILALPKHFAPVVLALLALLHEYLSLPGENPAAGIIEDLTKAVLKISDDERTEADRRNDNWRCIAAAKKVIDDVFDQQPATLQGADPGFDVTAHNLKILLPELVTRLNEHMRKLFDMVDGGRFLVTLLFATAYEQTSELATTQPSAGYIAFDDVERATDNMMSLLKNIRLSLVGGHPSARANAVIEEVLSSIRRRADRGEQLPITLDWNGDEKQPGTGKGVPPPPASAAESETPAQTAQTDHSPGPEGSYDHTWPELKPILHRLMMEIIWHLAIVGQPLEQEVLEICPRILAICKEIESREWHGTKIRTRTCVNNAIALALNRCLIYELCTNERAEYAGNEANAPRLGRRFTVHRSVQRYVFRSLGASAAEFPDADQFTLSFYASQPDDLPRLSTEGHRVISNVIAALSAYPREPGAEEFRFTGSEEFGNVQIAPTGDRQADEEAARKESARRQLQANNLKRQRLRASLGIMRSIYSVAVLSRFDRRPERDSSLVQEGYFEEHRRRIRWLLKASSELTHAEKRELPFYSEEVVWLYNECAVLSTVEGRLSDAQALFSAGLEAAKRIEPDETGPLHVRILLNRSICDIERGHGSDARAVLQSIATIRNEHVVPPLIAKGYLGLIDHLAGEISQAETRYREAISGLAAINRSRAASIFSDISATCWAACASRAWKRAFSRSRTRFILRRRGATRTSAIWPCCRSPSAIFGVRTGSTAPASTRNWTRLRPMGASSVCQEFYAR